MEITKENHIEVSDGDTKLVSSVLCPLNETELLPNQLFENNDGKKVVMCCIQGQQLEDGTFKSVMCPHFYGAVHPFKLNLVDCRHKDQIAKVFNG